MFLFVFSLSFFYKYFDKFAFLNIKNVKLKFDIHLK